MIGRPSVRSTLVSDVDESSGSFQVEDSTDFPDDGFLRIADLGEMILYTERVQNDLSMPLGRIDPAGEGHSEVVADPCEVFSCDAGSQTDIADDEGPAGQGGNPFRGFGDQVTESHDGGTADRS